MNYFCTAMSIKSNIPQIALLRQCVEERFGKPLTVHADFVELVSQIEILLRQHISESTLERVWGYSTRGYDTVSLRTLDVLAQYATGRYWDDFCRLLHAESKCESELFDVEHISSSDLSVGDRLQIGWLPDRLCEVRYLGDNRFVAEHCENSKMQPGDTFTCPQFTLGKELTMTNLHQAGAPENRLKMYSVGSKNGLTTLRHLH